MLAFAEQNRWMVLQIYFVPCTRQSLPPLRVVDLHVQHDRIEPILASEIYLASDQPSTFDQDHRCWQVAVV